MMTLTAFTEGPQQIKGRETPSHGQGRTAELNKKNFCEASLQVASTRIAQTPSLAKNHLKEGKAAEKCLPSMHHLHFPLLRGKRKTK